MVFFTEEYTNTSTDDSQILIPLLGMTILILAFFIGLLVLLYRLIYGILTRKLKKNYTELQKLEV